MSDPIVSPASGTLPPAPPPVPGAEPPAPPATAESIKTEEQAEHMIPKSRLDDVLAKHAATEKELKALKEADAARKKAEMSDLEKAQAEATAAKAETIEKNKELAALKAEKAFDVVVKKLGFMFQNDKARDDAFAAMDPAFPEDFEKALKDYTKERPYALKTVETPDLDAEKKNKEKGNGALTDAENAALKKRFRISN